MHEHPSSEGCAARLPARWFGHRPLPPEARASRGESAGAEGAGPPLGQEWASPARTGTPSERHWDFAAGRDTVGGAFGGAKAGPAPHHSCPSTCRGRPPRPARVRMRSGQLLPGPGDARRGAGARTAQAGSDAASAGGIRGRSRATRAPRPPARRTGTRGRPTRRPRPSARTRRSRAAACRRPVLRPCSTPPLGLWCGCRPRARRPWPAPAPPGRSAP